MNFLSPAQLIILALVAQGETSIRGLTRQAGGCLVDTWSRISTLRCLGYLTNGRAIHRPLTLTPAGRRAACGLLLSRSGERVTGVWRVNLEATTRAWMPLIDETETLRMAAVDYEEMAS